MFRQYVVDFTMARDGLFLTSVWIQPDVVTTTVTKQFTIGRSQ